MVHNGSMRAAADTFVIGDLPQLRLIAWNRNRLDAITGAEAFDLYERNWRFVDQHAMLPYERAIVDRLIHEYGHGIMHV
jgi:hypothetical protein